MPTTSCARSNRVRPCSRTRATTAVGYHLQTQGTIEPWHQTLKNRILLENYYLPGDLRQQIEAFVDHYNHQRYHKSLQNLTPADVYFGRGQTILKQRERIKRKTIETRRLLQRKSAASLNQQKVQDAPLDQLAICSKTPDDGHRATLDDDDI